MIVLADDIDRDQVIDDMASVGIETTVGTYACHQHPAFSALAHGAGDFPNAERFASQALTLPLVPKMAGSEVEQVVEALATTIGSV